MGQRYCLIPQPGALIGTVSTPKVIMFIELFFFAIVGIFARNDAQFSVSTLALFEKNSATLLLQLA